MIGAIIGTIGGNRRRVRFGALMLKNPEPVFGRPTGRGKGSQKAGKPR